MKQIKQLATMFMASVTMLAITGCQSSFGPPEPINVLLLSGQNNHKWEKTTPVLKKMLESNGRFKVTVTNSPEKMTAETLKGIDLVLSNWNTYGRNVTVKEWEEPAKEAFIDFMKNGGGMVVVHAGGTGMDSWKEYHQIVGAAWGKGSGHGSVHEFDVKLTVPHIITNGMMDFRTNEELWHRMVVNGDIKVLATAFSSTDKGGSGRDEPVAFVTEYGKGRCFNLVLGAFAETMEASPEFKTLLLRGSEWAGTGNILDKK